MRTLLRIGLRLAMASFVAACAAPDTRAPVTSAPAIDAGFAARIASLAATTSAAAASPRPAPALRADLPLRFEPNRGQRPGAVRFAARAGGFDVTLEADGVSLRTPTPPGDAAPPVLRLVPAGARAPAVLEAEDRLPGVAHYYLGRDPSRWIEDVPAYGRVVYRDVWPGIDWVVRSDAGRLEHDFVLAPGADPAAIRIAVPGADALAADADGALVARFAGGTVRQLAPIVYQEADGARRRLDGRFVVDGDTVGFAIAGRDPARPVTIDPVVLVWSTYLGGGGEDQAEAVAVTPNGDVVVGGSTSSSDFPLANAVQPFKRGIADAFVTRFDASGTQLVYSTFLGGGNSDSVEALGVDAAGNATAAGFTYSPEFPVRNAAQPTFGGDIDGFVVRLDPLGRVVWSTFLGGNRLDQINALAEQPNGTVWVAGDTSSPNFPATPGAYDTSCGTDGACNGNPAAFLDGRDTFAARFGPAGDLAWATFLGGSSTADYALAIAVDAGGDAHVGGMTLSDDWPTVNALRSHKTGPWEDGFVSTFSPDGTTLLQSTYLGGSQTDDVRALAVDASGDELLVAGSTSSTDFPLLHAIDAHLDGYNEAYVLRFAWRAASLRWSTFLGGSGQLVNGDFPQAAAFDPVDGGVVVAGQTTSSDFPLVEPLMGPRSDIDGFVTKLRGDGSALLWSTALAGTNGLHQDLLNGLAIDGDGTVYVAGTTDTHDFPTTGGAFSRQHRGGQFDAFVTKLRRVEPAFACDVAVDAASYATGDVITASALRFANQTGFFVAAAFRIVLELPGGGEVVAAQVGHGPTGLLPPGLDHDLAPAKLMTVGTQPRGSYALRCEVDDPATGAVWASDRAPFAIQ